MSDFATGILEAGLLESYDGSFAGGAEANNHLSLDKLTEHQELFEKVTEAMAHLILAHNCRVDFLAPIPSGGNVIAETVSQKLRRIDSPPIPVVHFTKTEDGLFVPRGHNAKNLLNGLENGVIIDDVSTAFTSLGRFLNTPELKGKNMSFCAIWRRGTEEIEQEVKDQDGREVTKYWLVEKPIPNIIDKKSDLAKYLSK
jgi:orotate phosphoribosyltransferase